MTPEQRADIHARCFTSQRPWSAAEFFKTMAEKSVMACDHTAGFILGRIIEQEAEVLTFAVDPDHQSKGIGRRLLAEFDLCCRNAGVSEIFLEVAESNQIAREFYESAGYTEIGVRKGYYRRNPAAAEAALIMKKRL